MDQRYDRRRHQPRLPLCRSASPCCDTNQTVEPQLRGQSVQACALVCLRATPISKDTPVRRSGRASGGRPSIADLKDFRSQNDFGAPKKQIFYLKPERSLA
jgi:hypothetical protein